MEERVGQQFGNFQVIRLLQSGKLADVYLAEHSVHKTQAALKVLHAQLSGQEVQDFLAEAQRIADLKHPNIARLLKAGVKGGRPYLATLYLSHGTLRTRHPRGSKLLLETAISYARQAAEGLYYAHEQGLVHQDLKPENLFLTSRSEVLVADFGIALRSSGALSFTKRATAGTAEYMAPEQALGQVSPVIDQYGLAVIVYEWLAGAPPFTGRFSELVAKHSSVPPPSLCAQLPNLVPAVEEVIFTALEKDPTRRFATMRAFVQALERASLQQAPIAFQPTERVQPPPAAGAAAIERAQTPPAAPAAPLSAVLPPTERVPGPSAAPLPPGAQAAQGWAPPPAAALPPTERVPGPSVTPFPPPPAAPAAPPSAPLPPTERVPGPAAAPYPPPPAAPLASPPFPPAALPPTERVPGPSAAPFPPAPLSPLIAALPLPATEPAPPQPAQPGPPPAFPPIAPAAQPLAPAPPAYPAWPVATERAQSDHALLPPPPPPPTPAFFGTPAQPPAVSPPFVPPAPPTRAVGAGIGRLLLLVAAALVVAGLLIGVALLVSHH